MSVLKVCMRCVSLRGESYLHREELADCSSGKMWEYYIASTLGNRFIGLEKQEVQSTPSSAPDNGVTLMDPFRHPGSFCSFVPQGPLRELPNILIFSTFHPGTPKGLSLLV